MKKVFITTFLLLTIDFCPAQATFWLTRSNKPNIILILTDDLDARSIEFMPQLQTLLTREGVTFVNSFATTTICCPSRASILSGQYTHNHQVIANMPPAGGFQKFYDLRLERSTIATWLQTAGYRTAFVGKYLNRYPENQPSTYVPPGWNEWYAHHKGPNYFNFKLNENGRVVQYGSEPEHYRTDVEARKALEFIYRSISAGAPFFLYFAPFAPHDDANSNGNIPPVPAPRHANEFAGMKAPRPPSFNEEDVSDKPKYVSNRPRLVETGISAIIDERYPKRLQTMLAVDEMISQLISTLKDRGVLENTYIFFMSDNGYHLGEHRLPAGKSTAYEEDIRVPLIVRGPGVPAGRVLEHFALNIDLAPTFAELAEVMPPKFVDGRSLMPLLVNSPPPVEAWRQDFLVEYLDPSTPETNYAAVRTRDYKYVEWNTGEKELYDLRNDPYELLSLHNTAEPALLAQLSSRVHELKNCAGINCLTAYHGDLDLNGKVTPVDALLILKQIVGKTTFCNQQLLNANVSLDTTVSALDASLILRYSTGLIERLPFAPAHDSLRGSFSLVTDNQEVKFGQTVEVSLNLDTDSHLYAFEGTIDFNSDKLTLDTLLWSPSVQELTIQTNAIPGRISVAAAADSLLRILKGPLATLRFIVNHSFRDDSTIVTVRRWRWDEDFIMENIAAVTFFRRKEMPKEFVLHQNNPNPFNSTTSMTYQLPIAAKVTLSIYNVAGQLIETLVDKHQDAGYHSAVWKARNVNSGLYFYRLKVADYTVVKKCLVLK